MSTSTVLGHAHVLSARVVRVDPWIGLVHHIALMWSSSRVRRMASVSSAETSASGAMGVAGVCSGVCASVHTGASCAWAVLGSAHIARAICVTIYAWVGAVGHVAGVRSNSVVGVRASHAGVVCCGMSVAKSVGASSQRWIMCCVRRIVGCIVMVMSTAVAGLWVDDLVDDLLNFLHDDCW